MILYVFIYLHIYAYMSIFPYAWIIVFICVQTYICRLVCDKCLETLYRFVVRFAEFHKQIPFRVSHEQHIYIYIYTVCVCVCV